MSVPILSIHTTPGALSIQRVPPRLQVERTDPEISIRSHKPQVAVDRTDYRDAVEVRLPRELAAHLHAKAVQAATDAIGEIAAEGTQFARIEDKAASSVSAAAQRAMPMDEANLRLRSVPPPVFTVTPGGVEVRITPGKLSISSAEAPLRVDYRNAVVTVDTEVPPQINRTA